MIPIRNVYHMLAYAFQRLKDDGYHRCATEDFEHVAELLAEILIHGISIQLKRGLQKDYSPVTERTGSIRGKINISESIKSLSFLQASMVCEYDIFDENCHQNRVLKTTAQLLLKADIRPEQKQKLRKLLLHFGNVETLSPDSINWHLHFNRTNQSYQMLMYVCRMVIQGLLQTQDAGPARLRHFVDDDRLHHLYEKFILNYYRREHPSLRTSSEQIPWAIQESNGTTFLPVLQTDVILRRGDKTLIIDAKFYNQNLCSKFGGRQKLHRDNVNQIYVYVDNYRKQHPEEHTHGLLLYARTDACLQPEMETEDFSVRTLDLGMPFEQIAAQLDSIAHNFLA